MQFPVEYSSLSAKALLQYIISNYDIAKNTSITFLKRGFNDTYLINSDKEKYILRLYKCNWRNLDSIETEIKLLNYLKENNISVSYAVKDKKEKYIQEVEAPEGVRYAVLFSYADGTPVRRLSAEQAYILGVDAGKMHSLTKNRLLGVTAHNYEAAFQFGQILNIVKPVLSNHHEEYNYLLKLQEEYIKVFEQIDMAEVAVGICHGDLQAENFHIAADNQITFFDFDFFGRGCLVYDIGVFMWYDHKNKPPEIIRSFLKGYDTQRRLSEAETKLIPYFSTLRALFQMSLYCKISDGQQLPLWPAQQVADFIKKVEKWHLKYTEVNNGLL